MSDAIVFDTPEKIQRFVLASLKGRLELEINGMKCHGPTAFSLLRKQGYKGNRQSVLEQVKKGLNV